MKFLKPYKMYYKIFQIIVLNVFFLTSFNCNTNKKEIQSSPRKPYLLYFNERDSLSFKKHPGLLKLKDTTIQYLTIPYYWKGKINIDTYKNGIMYSIGPRHRFIQSKINSSHNKKYLHKDSLNNYDIVKEPWKGIEINILDVSNPDSAFIVTVDYIAIEQ